MCRQHRQAAVNLTLWFSQWLTADRLVADGRRTRRCRRATHQTDRETSEHLYTVLENTVGSRRFATGCFYSGDQYQGIYFLQMKCEENIEIKNLFCTKRLTSV